MPEVKCGFVGADLLTWFGPTLKVDIGFDPDCVPDSGAIPIPGITGTQAIVDTGAHECCIDSMLASQLNLPIVDRSGFSGAHGPGEVNIHLAQIRVPELGFTVFGRFAGVHLAAGGSHNNALIGRTFRQFFTVKYDGRSGEVTIST